MRERFILDRRENILFINFAGLRIESHAQVDEMARLVREAYETQGGRVYAVVNYEGAEIAPELPELIDYYGERIKELHDRYSLATARYSSSGFTRSVLRYLGAAKDLESNIFVTREEAIDAIHELEHRRQRVTARSFWTLRNKLRLCQLLGLVVWAGFCGLLFSSFGPERWKLVGLLPAGGLLIGWISAWIMNRIVQAAVIEPVQEMERVARQLSIGSAFEPVQVQRRDEVGQLAESFNRASETLRRDIERLSGLYHIALLIGTGTEVSKICELLTGKIARLLGAEMCVILLYDERDRTIYAQLPGYGVSDEQLLQLRSGLEQESIAAWVFTNSEPYLTNAAARDAMISRPAAEMLGVREMLAVPLRAGERTLGTLEVMNKAGGFLEEDKRLVTIFAAQAAQLLANAQLLEMERRMAQQLIASERFAAVGELVAGVAHEVRNPLFGITTTLSALSRKLADRDAARPFLEVVNTEVGRLNHLMEQLLEHSRPVKFDPLPTDLREVIREALAELRPQAEAKGMTLSCECADDLPLLRLDRRKLHGVFTNLLDNALQHCEPNQEVRLAVAAVNGGAQVQVVITDAGSGIAPENLSKVFDPFFTTRANGTGLGLAIVRQAVHDHGGAITVSSEPGKGTSFIIHLPQSR